MFGICDHLTSGTGSELAEDTKRRKAVATSQGKETLVRIAESPQMKTSISYKVHDRMSREKVRKIAGMHYYHNQHASGYMRRRGAGHTDWQRKDSA
jgi:hypothetical protein